MLPKWTVAGAAIGAATALAGTPASAHHSILAIVDTSAKVVVDMVLTRVDWTNPHVWFHFSMVRPDGTVIREVPVEWLGIGAMHRSGMWSAEAFTIGAHYKVTYYPNRDSTFGGEVVNLVDETGHIFEPDANESGPAVFRQPPPPAPAPLTTVRY